MEMVDMVIMSIVFSDRASRRVSNSSTRILDFGEESSRRGGHPKKINQKEQLQAERQKLTIKAKVKHTH